MAQITSGLRSMLSNAHVYSLFQTLLGAEASRRKIVSQHVRAKPGDVVVDVGCGPAEILAMLPSGIHYHGFDLSQAYVDAARSRFPTRGTFHCADLATMPASAFPDCQIAIAIGLLHHLEDGEARSLLSCIHARLVPGGRLVTVDPAYWDVQSRAARFLVSRDRGRNVRSGDDYRRLATPVFQSVELIRRDDLLRVPYSHAILECTK